MYSTLKIQRNTSFTWKRTLLIWFKYHVHVKRSTKQFHHRIDISYVSCYARLFTWCILLNISRRCLRSREQLICHRNCMLCLLSTQVHVLPAASTGTIYHSTGTIYHSFSRSALALIFSMLDFIVSFVLSIIDISSKSLGLIDFDFVSILDKSILGLSVVGFDLFFFRFFFLFFLLLFLFFLLLFFLFFPFFLPLPSRRLFLPFLLFLFSCRNFFLSSLRFLRNSFWCGSAVLDRTDAKGMLLLSLTTAWSPTSRSVTILGLRTGWKFVLAFLMLLSKCAIQFSSHSPLLRKLFWLPRQPWKKNNVHSLMFLL